MKLTRDATSFLGAGRRGWEEDGLLGQTVSFQDSGLPIFFLFSLGT